MWNAAQCADQCTCGSIKDVDPASAANFPGSPNHDIGSAIVVHISGDHGSPK
jgi:hypothetical protein